MSKMRPCLLARGRSTTLFQLDLGAFESTDSSPVGKSASAKTSSFPGMETSLLLDSHGCPPWKRISSVSACALMDNPAGNNSNVVRQIVFRRSCIVSVLSVPAFCKTACRWRNGLVGILLQVKGAFGFGVHGRPPTADGTLYLARFPLSPTRDNFAREREKGERNATCCVR